MTEKTELLSAADAAALMSTTQLNVLMHIKRGLLIGEEVDGAWYVRADSVAAYMNEKGEAAHGSICKSHCKHGCSSSCD